METINPTFSYLTNLEVMQILQKIKSTKKKFGMRNLATVTYEALQYLEESPCKTQSRENIVNYVKDLSSYRLKSHEILQMINDPPTSALHTQLLIDDNKAPLTDEENEKIIQLSYKHFHGAETKEAKEAAKETPAEKPAEATAKTAGKQSGKRGNQAKEAEKATASKANPTEEATPAKETIAPANAPSTAEINLEVAPEAEKPAEEPAK
ncbi:DNA-directed RNA polymerase III subunit RPC9 [Drosophila rhopaloa]|uniref:DNA-directed RNA polymerase III subunit RPC9 n=1 Tax=Drosophila rhopaloa TaxID=1041015 RepID=A0A6P4FFT6_DRORH|nr:DNA-directed RNA polymerase III subunit RPC9 [Drosophila rhopaloa]